MPERWEEERQAGKGWFKKEPQNPAEEVWIRDNTFNWDQSVEGAGIWGENEFSVESAEGPF